MKPDQFQNIAPNPGSEKEMFEMLVRTAMENKHFKFEFIRNWEMRKLCKHQVKGLKKVIQFFKGAKRSAEEIWLYELTTGNIDLKTPIMCSELRHCLEYYEIELKTIKEMLSEHREYMFSFHLLDTLVFNRWRPDSECYDHRKLFKKK